MGISLNDNLNKFFINRARAIFEEVFVEVDGTFSFLFVASIKQ
jgi:hypothetical protein